MLVAELAQPPRIRRQLLLHVVEQRLWRNCVMQAVVDRALVPDLADEQGIGQELTQPALVE